MFSHSLHVLEVNDFNKRVGNKRAPYLTRIAVIVRNELIDVA